MSNKRSRAGVARYCRGYFFVALAVGLATWGTLVGSRAFAQQAPPRVVVSEIFADPLLLADCFGEFVELANIGTTPAKLSELSILGTKGRVWRITGVQRDLLRAGEVVVVRPMRTDGRAEQLQAVADGMSLPDRAGRLQLRWRGQLLDTVQWWSKRPWPKHRRGSSLERRSAQHRGEFGRSWRRSKSVLRVIERGSPGTVSWLAGRPPRRYSGSSR